MKLGSTLMNYLFERMKNYVYENVHSGTPPHFISILRKMDIVWIKVEYDCAEWDVQISKRMTIDNIGLDNVIT